LTSLSAPMCCIAQDDTYPKKQETTSESKDQMPGPYKWIKMEKGDVFFEKVYNLENTDAASIEHILMNGVPRVKDISGFTKTSDIITAEIKNTLVDYRKYGGKWGTTAVYMNHPFFATVSILWKDNKYKVTVSNMYFNTAGLGKMTGGDVFTKRGREFDHSKIVMRSGEYLEQYLSDLFAFDKLGKSEW